MSKLKTPKMHFLIDQIIRNHEKFGLVNILTGLDEVDQAYLKREEPDFYRLVLLISRSHGRLEALIHSYNKLYQIKQP